MTAPRFVHDDSPVAVAVVVVTFQNADDVDRLVACLRAEAAGHRLRVVFVDNDSADGSHQRAAAHDDVIAVAAGSNGGYARGINLASGYAGEAEAILVLNPDLVFEPGLIAALLARMRQSGAGIVVPRILDERGHTYPSLRREPALPAALGDALFGARWRGRPAEWSEIDWRRDRYEEPHRIAWATGAALMVRADVARAVGPWDESFFLYSEETDYFRRVRDAGYEIWYEPSVHVTHRQGGSGGAASARLTALMEVNKVGYFARHHGRVATGLFRAVAVLAALRRSGRPEQRYAVGCLLRGMTSNDVLERDSAPRVPSTSSQSRLEAKRT